MKKLLALIYSATNLFSLAAAESCPDIDFSCKSGKHPIHLTFDDGPGSQTPHIMSILREESVKATFFLQGEKIVSPNGKKIRSEQTARLMDDMLRDGHILGSHTYHHIHHLDQATGGRPNKTDIQMLQRSKINWIQNIEIQKQAEVLRPYMVNQDKMYIRLPYGQGWFKSIKGKMPSPVVLKEVLSSPEKDITPIHLGWNIDPEDWTNPPAQTYLTRLRDQLCENKGGVVLLHDHTKSTNANLSCLIRLAKAGGHHFVDRPDDMTKFRDGPNGPKVLMQYQDIAGIHLPPEKNCDESEQNDQVDQLEDEATALLNHVRGQDDYTPYEADGELQQ